MKERVLGFLLATLVLCPSPALARNNTLERIENFLEVLESNPSYLVSQEYDFSEMELAFVERLCGDDRDISAKERALCDDLRKKRFQDNSSAPSLYLLWLRRKLPKSHLVTALNIAKNPQDAHHVITVNIENVIVVFNLYNISKSFQPLVVRSINGKDIFDIVDQDIKNGLSISTLLKNSVR